MNHEMNEKVIQSYLHDEKMMILVYAQWCINNELDPRALYQQAYPNQINNQELEIVLAELTVSKEESEPIENQVVIQVLQLFGNDDLAFVVQNEINKKKSERKA